MGQYLFNSYPGAGGQGRKKTSLYVKIDRRIILIIKNIKICIPILKYISHFVLSSLLAKITSWVTFFLLGISKPDFGRLCSLPGEAFWMIQYKKIYLDLVLGTALSSCQLSPCASVAKSC
jgi:hypothetical protein